MNKPILKDLNEQQRQAVQHTEGPLLILAGPGSGKTRVLTNRIAYLIICKQTMPGQLLAVTFTNKAAQEMRTRTEGLTGLHLPDSFHFLPGKGLGHSPFIGTFHSFAARILRSEIQNIGFSPQFVIYDTDDQLKIMGPSN